MIFTALLLGQSTRNTIEDLYQNSVSNASITNIPLQSQDITAISFKTTDSCDKQYIYASCKVQIFHNTELIFCNLA